METEVKNLEHFDLNQPHMRVTGDKGQITIVQNGFIYAFSIMNPKVPNIGGKIIGKVADMKAAELALGHKFCDFCGYSFGTAEGLEEHLYVIHRDTLLVSLIQNNAAGLKVGELPSQEQLRGEARRLVGQEAEEALEREEKKKSNPAVKAFAENKKSKVGAYREPVK